MGGQSAYQDALPHAIHTPNGRRFEHAASQKQPPTDAVLILVMPAGCLKLCIGGVILWLGNTNDHHHFIMRANNIPINTLSFRVDRAASLIIQLLRRTQILWAFARDDFIIWRPPLKIRSDSERSRVSNQPSLTSPSDVMGPSLPMMAFRLGL